jgi:hypothetical protein
MGQILPLLVAIEGGTERQAAVRRSAPAILPTIAEPYLGGTPQRIDLPWLKKYCREIGVVWHERLLETRPKARELLEALKEMPKQVGAQK